MVAKSHLSKIVDLLRAYLDLCKLRVVGLIVFTAIIGMLLSSPYLIPLSLAVPAILGIGLAACSAAVINHVVEYETDALMDRTKERPIPKGGVSRTNAFIFAVILGLVSMTILIAFINILTAVLTFASLIGYAVIYTMYLKHATPQNIVIGGAAGAAPPVLGWTAVTGTVEPHSLLLFLIIFAWTPPHFWALAIYRREEYATAKIPMLPITHGVDYTRRQILFYTIILTVATILPYITYMNGLIYLVGAMFLNIFFLYYSLRMQWDHSDELARKVFRYSIAYLGILFFFFFLDHYSGGPYF